MNKVVYKNRCRGGSKSQIPLRMPYTTDAFACLRTCPLSTTGYN